MFRWWHGARPLPARKELIAPNAAGDKEQARRCPRQSKESIPSSSTNIHILAEVIDDMCSLDSNDRDDSTSQ